jgi:hypothetical protein
MPLHYRRPGKQQEGGHNFAFSDDACTKCGMSREHFEDHGKPRCKGRRSKDDASDAATGEVVP